jgi:hypothetical protein
MAASRQQQMQPQQQQQGTLATRSFFDDAFSLPWFGGRDLANIFQNEGPMLGACDIVETAVRRAIALCFPCSFQNHLH